MKDHETVRQAIDLHNSKVERDLNPPDMPDMNEDLEYEARNELLSELFSLQGKYTITDLLEMFCDDVPSAMDHDWQAFRRACAERDQAEIGRLVERALDRCADRWLESEPGQELIGERAVRMENEDEPV